MSKVKLLAGPCSVKALGEDRFLPLLASGGGSRPRYSLAGRCITPINLLNINF